LVLLTLHALSEQFVRLWNAYASKDASLLADGWIMTEQFLFHVPLFMAIIALFRRKLGLIELMVVTVVGHWLNEFNFFPQIVHGILFDNDLYPKAFKAPNGAVNVQYAILLVYFAIVPAIYGFALRKRTRTISRVFAALIITATLGTTLLFHKLVVEADLITTVDRARNERLAVMETAVTLPSEKDFQAFCTLLKTDCATLASDQPFTLGSPEMADAARSIHTNAMNTGKDKVVVPFKGRVGVLTKDLRGSMLVYARAGSSYRVILDNTSYNHFVWDHKVQFAILMSVAHLVWAYGGYLLLAFHGGGRVKRFCMPRKEV
jgi:hypothetical protein